MAELDSTSAIRSIVLKLHSSHHNKWNIYVENIKRKEGRKAAFEDLINFVDFHSSCANNPSYSSDAMNEARKERLKINAIKTKEDAVK